jgi:putative oxidoreductase
MSTLSQTISSKSNASLKEQPMFTLRNATELSGRILLASLFLLSGLGKLTAYAATAGYMASAGIPGALLPLVIATELLGSLAIILGWQTRVVSLLLAGFTLASGVLFHNNFADQMQMIMFLKNISIAGAFLMLAVNGAGALSLDARRVKVSLRLHGKPPIGSTR